MALIASWLNFAHCLLHIVNMPDADVFDQIDETSGSLLMGDVCLISALNVNINLHKVSVYNSCSKY